MSKKIYGVEQAFHGHIYRWIFTEDEIRHQFKKADLDFDDLVEDGACIDILWPIGGSNSSSTSFIELEDDDAVRRFLTTPGEHDSADPMLVDIAEFVCDISEDDDGQVTSEYLEKLDLTAADCHFEDDINRCHDRACKMLNGLMLAEYRDFDYEDPFYGYYSDMPLSELSSLYAEITGLDPDAL